MDKDPLYDDLFHHSQARPGKDLGFGLLALIISIVIVIGDWASVYWIWGLCSTFVLASVNCLIVEPLAKCSVGSLPANTAIEKSMTSVAGKLPALRPDVFLQEAQLEGHILLSVGFYMAEA